MRKRIIITVLLAFLIATIGGLVICKASKPVLLSSFRGTDGIAHDGNSEDYRELGAFTVWRWTFRQWWRERGFVAMTGCVLADQPGTKVGLGGSESSSPSSVVWNADIGVITEDQQTVIPRLTIKVEYDLAEWTATLLNTGEVLPFSEDKVFTVYVNKQFEIERFVVLDPSQELTPVHPALAERFSAITSDRRRVTEPRVEADGDDATSQP